MAVVIAALAALSQPPQALEGLEQVLRRHPQDLSLADLHLDSLGLMEFCIALEIDHGLAIPPERLAGIHSADQLLRRLQRMSGRG